MDTIKNLLGEMLNDTSYAIERVEKSQKYRKNSPPMYPSLAHLMLKNGWI